MTEEMRMMMDVMPCVEWKTGGIALLSLRQRVFVILCAAMVSGFQSLRNVMQVVIAMAALRIAA
jgi:hypothetical protein